MVTGQHLKKWLEAQGLAANIIAASMVGQYRANRVTRLIVQKGAAVHILDVHRAVTYLTDSHRQALVDEIKRLPATGPNLYRVFQSSADRWSATRWDGPVDDTWRWTDKKVKKQP